MTDNTKDAAAMLTLAGFAKEVSEGITCAFQPLIARLTSTVESHTSELRSLRSAIESVVVRRDISEAVKEEHLRAVRALGGRCPCCGLRSIIVDGIFCGEMDHFFARNRVRVTETWPLCTACHAEKTKAEMWTDLRRVDFDAYQARRSRLPESQLALVR